MDNVHISSNGGDALIPVAELRVAPEQIIRTEFVTEDHAILQVKIGEEIFTRGLHGEALSAYLECVKKIPRRNTGNS